MPTCPRGSTTTSYFECWVPHETTRSRPRRVTLALWVGALASLYIIKRNLWALAALPLIFAAEQFKLSVPRGRLGLYVYYPAHLAVLWIVVRLL